MATIKHIAIAGNIGSGKTTLTEKLGKHYGWDIMLEAEDTNPYLRDFYSDMPRWAFHVQIYFLNSRFKQVKQIHSGRRPIIQDRTIYEDAYIFAANLFASGHLTERDYQSYQDVFHSMVSMVPAPDLLIYLRADIPKLVRQIQKRGRDYENTMRLDYLKSLNDYYERWISNYKLGKLLIIDVNDLDFIERVDDFAFIVNKIEFELNNLFNT